MPGRVIYTNDDEREAEEIRAAASRATAQKVYVYGNDAADVPAMRERLPGFRFVALSETMSAAHAWMFRDNTPDDLFVLKYPRLSNIMDRNIDMHQIQLKGEKLVVEEHPFLGKSEVFWVYFPYSFFDKSLLGYPHSYAFRDSTAPGAFDVEMLAGKVRGVTANYLPHVFGGDIETMRAELSQEEHAEYAALKDELFATETTPRAIIRKLKAFVDSTYSVNWASGAAKHLNMLELNRMWSAYKSGIKTRVVTDAKVDLYLAGQMDEYVANVNGFLRALGVKRG